MFRSRRKEVNRPDTFEESIVSVKRQVVQVPRSVAHCHDHTKREADTIATSQMTAIFRFSSKTSQTRHGFQSDMRASFRAAAFSKSATVGRFDARGKAATSTGVNRARFYLDVGSRSMQCTDEGPPPKQNGLQPPQLFETRTWYWGVSRMPTRVGYDHYYIRQG